MQYAWFEKITRQGEGSFAMIEQWSKDSHIYSLLLILDHFFSLLVDKGFVYTLAMVLYSD